MVGYVMICYGVCDAICSITFSPMVKVIGRVPIFTIGAVINISIVITLIYWHPDPDETVVFFVLAGLWGISDAVWQTQINGELLFIFLYYYLQRFLIHFFTLIYTKCKCMRSLGTCFSFPKRLKVRANIGFF